MSASTVGLLAEFGVVPIADMVGDDDEDTHLLRAMHVEAEQYLLSHHWCEAIVATYFGLGVGGVVAVFLFEIARSDGADTRLWVVTGDLPSAYLVLDEIHSPSEALSAYCDLMDDWVSSVRGADADEVFPVAAARTAENAEMLARRIDFLRSELRSRWAP